MTVNELLSLIDGITGDCRLEIDGDRIFVFGPNKGQPFACINFGSKCLIELTEAKPMVKHVDGNWTLA